MRDGKTALEEAEFQNKAEIGEILNSVNINMETD